MSIERFGWFALPGSHLLPSGEGVFNRIPFRPQSADAGLVRLVCITAPIVDMRSMPSKALLLSFDAGVRLGYKTTEVYLFRIQTSLFHLFFM
jgi:hypothetical protein